MFAVRFHGRGGQGVVTAAELLIHDAALGARYALEAAMRATKGKMIAVNATGCLEVFSTPFPETSWQIAWLHSLFGNAPAVAPGMARGFRPRPTVTSPDSGCFRIIRNVRGWLPTTTPPRKGGEPVERPFAITLTPEGDQDALASQGGRPPQPPARPPATGPSWTRPSGLTPWNASSAMRLSLGDGRRPSRRRRRVSGCW